MKRRKLLILLAYWRGSPGWTISATGSSEKLRKPAYFREIRQGFAIERETIGPAPTRQSDNHDHPRNKPLATPQLADP